jgi:hypothetical protein
MKTTRKRWSQMTTEELAAATKEFDDPTFHPPAKRASKSDLSQLRRVQRKAARLRIAVALEKKLVEQADEYAAKQGISFSDLVSEALRRQMRRRSA